MNLVKYFVLAGIFLLIGTTQVELQAQIPPEVITQGRQILQEKGISEAEVQRRMLLRGYDVNNLDPARIPEYRKALQEVIAEIEAEKKAEKAVSPQQTQAPTPQVIKEVKKVEQIKQEDVDNIKEQIQENKEVAREEGSAEEKAAEGKSETLQKAGPEPNIYGHRIFSEGELSLYRAAEDVATPDNYVLSTGDVVLVSIFGRSQADFALKINEQGYVKSVNMPKIFLKGLKLKDARNLLRKRMSMNYSFLPNQFTATLVTARTVTLNIFGEVKQPGSYTISALNTGFNALLAAGGITPDGSVRKIKLIKGNGETKILDVYKYLSNPKVQFDYPIDDNDILYVPLSDIIVTINGAVRRPMKYELIEGEGLKDLINYAGGLRSNAYTELAQISRLVEEERVLIDIPLQRYLNSDAGFQLRDGDIITIKAVEGELKRFVEASGAVKYPGKYDFNEGMTLSDLVKKARFDEFTRRDLVFLFRQREDGTVFLRKLNLDSLKMSEFELQAKDRFVFYSVKQFMNETLEIGITGAVRNPVTITFDPENSVRIADLITYAGGLKPNAMGKAIVKRIDRSNKEKVNYLEVNVFKALADTSSNDNIFLQQGDMVTVFANEAFTKAYDVEITGEVRDPQTMRYDESLDLKTAILIAGGLKPNANNIAIIQRHPIDNSKEVSYIRINLNQVFSGEKVIDLRPKDVIRVYDKNVYMDEFQVSIIGEVKSPGKFQYDESLTIKDLIYMAGGLTLKAATNKVELYRLQIMKNEPTQILTMEITLDKKTQDEISVEEDIQLQPYDIIVVRPIPDFEYQEIVYVTGEVVYPGPYILDKNKNDQLTDVIRMAGGIEPGGFTSGATLIRKNGQKQGQIMINLERALKNRRSHENIVVMNGDVLYIPKLENTVSIRTIGTESYKVISESNLVNNTLQMAFQGKRSARWYINNYAGGFSESADRGSVRVIYPGGRINSTRTYFWFIHDYPTVVEGSTVAINLKPPEPPKEEKKKEEIDWNVFLRDTISIVTSVVTLLVLLNQLNK